jgi:8-oxo-dGTP diphosphatase
VSEVVAKRLKRKVGAVLCSHGPVLPRIIAEIAARTETEADAALRRAASLDTGDFTVLHVSLKHPRSGIVAVETHSPA